MPGFVIQTGCPLGDGTGGESIYGRHFEDEIRSKLSHDRKGTLSMANTGRNQNGSQFFVSLAPAPHLDGKHTVFGCVTDDKSLTTLSDLELVKCKNNRPVMPPKM